MIESRDIILLYLFTSMLAGYVISQFAHNHIKNSHFSFQQFLVSCPFSSKNPAFAERFYLAASFGNKNIFRDDSETPSTDGFKSIKTWLVPERAYDT